MPLPFIEEMCNCGTVTGTIFLKIDSLFIISERKDRSLGDSRRKATWEEKLDFL